MFSPTKIFSLYPIVFNSFMSITGSLLRPWINIKTNFSVIFVILPSIISIAVILKSIFSIIAVVIH